jgi:hypothetical protein
MGCLHVDDAPDELLELLHRLARRQHDSVSNIVLGILRRALLSPDARQGRLFPRAARKRSTGDRA